MTDLAGNGQQTTCLDKVRQDELDRALERCNQWVASQPKRAEAYSERALILLLRGERREACSDLAQALNLIQTTGSSDPVLKHELTVRQAACSTERSNAGKG